MTPRARARAAWLLVAALVAYALASVATYVTTGAFTRGWLVTSLVVYALVLACALALAAVDAGALASRRVAAPAGEPRLLHREATYRSTNGVALRLTYLWPDSSVETRHVAITPGELRPLHEIETQLDALDAAPSPPDLDDLVSRALARHAHKEASP